MRSTIGFLALVMLLIAAHSAPALIIDVPGDSTTIQAGINGAASGDTVMVAAGTYTGNGNRDLDLFGKAILVTSVNGPRKTIIDCQGNSLDPHRGFYFNNGEGSGSVIQGFTIRNGWAADGGAVYCWDASPTISGNIIELNEAATAGGGIFCATFASPTITDNIIAANQALGGGGIYCWENSNPTISDNLIEANLAVMEGGGIFLYVMCSGTISGNTIRGNIGMGMGGGICCGASFPMIVDNTIEMNVGERGGGGIACWYYSSPVIDRNTIAGNMSMTTSGGGVWCYQMSSPAMDGNTVTANHASNGGGIGCDTGSYPTVTNSILRANVASVNPEIYVGSLSTITVTYSDVDGGWPGTGNINADPTFVLPGNQDYRLLWGSPCIDAGQSGLSDPDGTPRDMGAHFFDQSTQLTIYVTPDSPHVVPGGQLGVTYTVINRQAQPVPFSLWTDVILSNGGTLALLGPNSYTMPGNFTVQQYMSHNVPGAAPHNRYQYRSCVGVHPGTIYDQDMFSFLVP